MKISETNIPGVLLIESDIYRDQRGFFSESYSQKKYDSNGIGYQFVQDNLSHSKKNVIRGLHFQLKHPQGKLVRVARGRVYDVALDIRCNSPTFGEYFSSVIDDSNLLQIFMPPGIAHGFCVLSDEAIFEYKCTDYYVAGDEAGVLWNDPDLKIDWPIDDPTISDQDLKFPKLKDISKNNLPNY